MEERKPVCLVNILYPDNYPQSIQRTLIYHSISYNDQKALTYWVNKPGLSLFPPIVDVTETHTPPVLLCPFCYLLLLYLVLLRMNFLPSLSGCIGDSGFCSFLVGILLVWPCFVKRTSEIPCLKVYNGDSGASCSSLLHRAHLPPLPPLRIRKKNSENTENSASFIDAGRQRRDWPLNIPYGRELLEPIYNPQETYYSPLQNVCPWIEPIF